MVSGPLKGDYIVQLAVEVAGPVNYVGGTIFYIDENATGTYTFKNALGATVSAPSVGTDCTGWTYEVTGGNGLDKYYVADLTNHTYLNRQYDGTYEIVWSTQNENYGVWSDHMDVLSEANNTVGTGKRNSAWVMQFASDYSDVFAPKAANPYGGKISVWEIMHEANAAEANGCEDWYCPSVGELTKLRNNSGLTLQQWNDSFAYDDTVFVLSSSVSADDYGHGTKCWGWFSYYPSEDYAYSQGFSGAPSEYACVLIRSF